MRTIAALALVAFAATGAVLAGDRDEPAPEGAGEAEAAPAPALEEAEREDLVYLREEEKLARDVYRALHATFEIRAFSNIAASEQRHMDAVGALLRKYGVEDPVGDRAEGVFRNEELQKLYDKLVKAGRESELHALTVGATIEDLDIRDLGENIARTDKEDLLVVYQNLRKGSRNHMRAFVGLLEARNATYEARFLTAEELEQILESPHERGRVDARGRPDRTRGGGRGHGRGRHGRGEGRGRGRGDQESGGHGRGGRGDGGHGRGDREGGGHGDGGHRGGRR
jgi:hypothetical protein